MTLFALLIAVIMIAAGVLLIGLLLLLRNGPQAGESVPKYGDCYDLCKRDSGEAEEDCVGLCAYGWP